jgi:two-component system, NarL family, response regulator LiaR
MGAMSDADERLRVRIVSDAEVRIRVLIADDQTLFRRGLATLLARDSRIEIVGEVGDGTEALREVEGLRPDIVLLDLKMPGMDGGEAAVRIHAEFPNVRIVMLSTFGADADVVQAMRAGARGYLLKDTEPEALINCLLSVMSGEIVMDGPIASRVVDMAVGNTSLTRHFYDGLTRREVQIIKLVASGLGNKQIAYRLGISTKTVSNHVSNSYVKLNIADRSQAALYAVRKGLIDA